MGALDLHSFLADNPWIADNIWVFAFGSMVALLRSVVDGVRRSGLRLFVGCIFGGLGAVLIHDATQGDKLRLIYTGLAAVITEQIVIGIHKAGIDFSSKPFEILSKLLEMIPHFRAINSPPEPLPPPEQPIENNSEEMP